MVVSPLLNIAGVLLGSYRLRPQVVMLSQRFWQQQFGGDPRNIGTSMRLNGQAFTVIGIMPKAFDVPTGVDVWMPKAG